MTPRKSAYGAYGLIRLPPPARYEVAVSLNCPGVSNQECSGFDGTAAAVELLGTGTCKGVKVRRPLVLEQLALTPYGSAITSLGGCMFPAHEATLCDDDGTESPSVEALVCVKTGPRQKKECDLQGVGIGVGQGENMSCNVTR